MPEQKVVVTGGAGFLGSHLVERLLASGRMVTVIDNLSSGKEKNLDRAAVLVKADIRSAEARDVIGRVKPELLFHVAAQISVSVSAREPALDADVNVMGGLNIMTAAAQAGVRKVVFVSTGGAMYGDARTIPTPETSPAQPLSPYGASKFAFENYLRVFKHLHGVDYAVVRPANIYGPRQDPHGEAGVVAIFTRAMLSGGTCKIFGDGADTRDYVYAGDLADLLVKAAEGNGTGPYNGGTGQETSATKLFQTVASLTGYSKRPEHVPARAGDLHRSALDSGKATRELGWRPVVSLVEGLGRTVEHFSKNG